MADRETRHATPGDIALVRKSEEDIRAEVSRCSFDIAALKRRVRDDDLAQAFIQTHLYLDHVISLTISENIPHPRQLQLDRAGFSQKLQLSAALGLLGPAFVAPIKVINSIRNKIAHQLEYEVQPTDEAKLRSVLGKHAAVEPDGTATPTPELLRILAVMVDLQRQERAYERIMRDRAISNARIVLDGIILDEEPPAGG
jgi:hypothetical protein